MPKLRFAFKSWNPTIGCSKISEGCLNCYAQAFALRLQRLGSEIYKDGFEFKMLPQRLAEPLNNKTPTIYFVNSMSDLFHEQIAREFLDKILCIVERSPRHQFQILTKRPQRMREYFSTRPVPPNLWLGATVECTSRKDRIELIRDINASVKWLSCEPLVESLGKLDLRGIDWVVVGGESGTNARAMKPEWAREILRACNEQGVAFYFHQWGAYGEDGVLRSKEANGKTLDGKIYRRYPPKIEAMLYEKTLFD